MKKLKSYTEFSKRDSVTEELTISDLKKYLKKTALVGTLAAGASGCAKQTPNYIYQYSYEIAGRNVTDMYAFNRELTPEEILEIDAKGDEIMTKHWGRPIDGNLAFYRIDQDGDYQAKDPNDLLRK